MGAAIDPLVRRCSRLIRGVLFDLDGTLLDIDIDEFLSRYFASLEVAVEGFLDGSTDPGAIMQSIMASTAAMMRPHSGATNQATFYAEFKRLTGLDLTEHWDVFERFYTDVFPDLRGSLGPAPGARAALETARHCGCKVAIATNPIFPRLAIEHRLSWAGFEAHEADVITDYETMCACKPSPEYFRQTATMLGVEPADCLMVGDDRHLDLAAGDIGMRTFYVGNEEGTSADYCGDLSDLASLLMRSCGPGESL